MVYAIALQAQKQFTLASPNGKVNINISVGETICYSVSHDGDLIIKPSPISMTLTDGRILGNNAKLLKIKRQTIQQSITPIIYKRSKIHDHYQELTLLFKGNYSLVFRAYDEGMAYRFMTDMKKEIIVKDEQVVYDFPNDHKAFIPYVRGDYASIEGQYANSFENLYEYTNLTQWDAKRLAFSPLVVEGPHDKKVCLAEADLIHYPGMFLHNVDNSTKVTGKFAYFPKEIVYAGHNNLQGVVKSREDYIARCEGKTNFPWRVMIIVAQDKYLADCDMIYKLSTPASPNDYSWIKPGKVAWDWWNDWNLYGVDFRAGINNDTYKYYIDFASRYGIEYVILDEGWAVNLKANLFEVVPEINLEELVRYADSRQVGLILWAGYYAFERDMEKVCRHYSAMGIKGFKIDFMDRDDQMMVDFHTRAAETAGRYKLLVDFHGTYKPTGLQRTYPNVINFEGVHGLEQMKWSESNIDQVTYDVTIPFIRMVAGPMDYTQGAMRNAIRANYTPVNSEAMSQGTRCRQLAQYIVFDSPLNMLADSPSNYMREPECTKFIVSMPTTWDNTIALDGKIAQYIAMARRKGDTWYVGTLTDWDARVIELDLSFLGTGNYMAEIFYDGINADRIGCDYIKKNVNIPANRKLSIPMAPGGGCAMKIIPIL